MPVSGVRMELSLFSLYRGGHAKTPPPPWKFVMGSFWVPPHSRGLLLAPLA